MLAKTGRIILTREKERNRAWATRLEAAGLPVLELPLVRFETLPTPEAVETGQFDWILFTSPQAVKAFVKADLLSEYVQSGDRLALRSRISSRPRVWFGALGDGTSTALADADLPDDLGIHSKDGAAFAAAFVETITAPANVLLPGPERRFPEPRQTLEQAGFKVTEIPLYRTFLASRAELPSIDFAPGDIIFFCSPSAVRAFSTVWIDRPSCVSIGKTTAQAARDAGFPTSLAPNPNLESMLLAAGLEIPPIA